MGLESTCKKDNADTINAPINVKFDSKTFPQLLAELDKSCQSNIFIKREQVFQSEYKKSSNIEACILWFNRLSLFISTEIVKNLDRNKRVVLINYFIDVAYACFELGNFNSAMSIVGNLGGYLLLVNVFLLTFFLSIENIAGLNSYNISRLRKTVCSNLYNLLSVCEILIV